MKNLNLFSVLILSATMLATGCHRKPNSLTPIPGVEGPAGQNNGGQTSGGTLPSGPEVTAQSNPTGIPQDYGNFSGLLNGPHNEDREKFKEDTVYFDFDQSSVKPSEESKLQDVATFFKSDNTDALIIEGNCDERGTEKYNLSLGERRALAVREYLANLGVNPQRIKTVTYGASRPAEAGHNEAAWKKNRRGDLVLVTPAK